MFAIHLQQFLANLCRNAEASHVAYDDMEKRFQSLRGYGRLPQGRENRDRPLTDKQIASVLFGLTITQPGWAGHAAAIMERRFPVGSLEKAFLGASSLLDALTQALGNENDRVSIIAIRMTTAECGVNSHGAATIIYDADGERRFTHYVPAEAVSLLQPGAEDGFDPDQRYSPFSRDTVFNRRFLDQLCKRVARDRAHPVPLPDDSAEYDAEEAERERRKRLRATSGSNFLNIGVDNQVTWPKEEMLVQFDKYHLVLMPKTKENVQSAHIDLTANRLTMVEGQTVINRMLSMMTWCDDQYAIAQDGWSGNPMPVPVSKRDLAFATAYHWVFSRTIPDAENARRALALYREARNAEQNFIVSYAVLNYYKVIELLHPPKSKPTATDWIASNIQSIIEDDREGLKDFLEACGEQKPEKYIYLACRLAVAHASPGSPSDPDDAEELRRLHKAAYIMRQLARRLILKELSVSSSPVSDAIDLDEKLPK